MSTSDAIVHDWPLTLGFESRDIMASDGTRLRLVLAGPKDAPPVILLHGAPQHAYEWRRVIPLLADRFRVIAPDLRGYGASDLSASGRYDVDILTEDLRIIAEAAGEGFEGGVRIIAHDWGGPIAWTFAERYPGLVKHLVAANAPHPAAYLRELARPRQLVRSWYVMLFQIPHIEALIEVNDAAFLVGLLRASSPRGLFSEEDLAMYRASLSRPGRARAAVAYYQQAFGPGRVERAKKLLASGPVRVPATILWGDADRAIASTHPEATRRYVENLEVHHLVGVSHWVPEERPVDVARSIRV